jgi:pyrroloquinoline quinone (PQQ) biosynthesis protein C
MNTPFDRQGEITELANYPQWVHAMVAATAAIRRRVVEHPLFLQMRDATLGVAATRAFLIGTWPTIEQFPQFMALSLLKARYGRSRGEDLARQFLIRNIRVENKHADHWRAWAAACDIGLSELMYAPAPLPAHALAHWCWQVCDAEPLAVAVAATNYAVEGATGEWSAVVCSKELYENSFAPAHRHAAMRWLRLHAQYDDVHPWEALDIVATLLGNEPSEREVTAVTQAVRKSLEYMALNLDSCLAQASLPIDQAYVQTVGNGFGIGGEAVHWDQASALAPQRALSPTEFFAPTNLGSSKEPGFASDLGRATRPYILEESVEPHREEV